VALIGYLARGVAVAALAGTSLIALTFWLVRTGRLAPFGPWPRTVRRLADPMLQPIERRLLASGRNPQDAPLWLFGAAVLGGLLLISLTDWLTTLALQARYAASGGGAGLAAFLVSAVFNVLIVALIVRVVASWFGIGAYRPWFRPVILLTDWLVVPIRRVLPPTGMIDFSPLVAWLVLVLARSILLRLV